MVKPHELDYTDYGERTCLHATTFGLAAVPKA
jgi:hypothetical protein